MASRELRIVDTEKKIGVVSLVDGVAVFEDAAQSTFAGLRRRYNNDVKLAKALLADGWSNGYSYLADAEGT
jgi:hypothetical protein